MSERLAAALDRARWVEYDPDGFVLAWFGGHGIHVYDLAGNEVDYLTVGDFSRNDAAHDEVTEAMAHYRLNSSAHDVDA